MLESGHGLKAARLNVESLDRRFRDVGAAAIKKHKEFCKNDSTSTARQAARARHEVLLTQLEGIDRVLAAYASVFGMLRTQLADKSLREASGPCFPSYAPPGAGGSRAPSPGSTVAGPGDPLPWPTPTERTSEPVDATKQLQGAVVASVRQLPDTLRLLSQSLMWQRQPCQTGNDSPARRRDRQA